MTDLEKVAAAIRSNITSDPNNCGEGMFTDIAPAITRPSKPVGVTPISARTMAYVCSENRGRLFTMLRKEFKRSGLTQKQLALRTGMKPETISRLLGMPRNMETDTVAKLMFGMAGGLFRYEPFYPFEAAQAPSTTAIVGLGGTGSSVSTRSRAKE